MTKGKSRTNFTGVSRFLDALKTDADSASSPQISDSTTRVTDDDSRPKKKQKLNAPKLLPSDSAYQSYDATGLVPFYTESSQVPEDLQKCTFGFYPLPPHTQKNARV